MKAILAGIKLHNGRVLIGTDGKLPWEVVSGPNADLVRTFMKTDMNWFTHHTKGKRIIMGSKTWESLGSKPLRNRAEQYVVTSREHGVFNVDFQTIHFGGLGKELDDFIAVDPDNTFVIGGAQIFNALLPKCDEVLLTLVSNGDLIFDSIVDENMKKREVTTIDFADIEKNRKKTLLWEYASRHEVLFAMSGYSFKK